MQIRRGSTITDFPPVDDDVEQFPAREEEEVTETEVARDGRPVVPSSGYEDPLRYEDPVMQISGAGHWFLEGWIGDHLVDSGSSVTAMSDSFYQNQVGALQVTARTLRGANGTGIEVMGCFALLGVVSGVADRVPHHHLQFGDGNRRHHWNRCVGFGAAAYPRH